jgi:hypothetical protein
MKTLRRCLIQDQSSRVPTRILKRGPARHLLASALASIAILVVSPIVTDKAAAQLTILHSFGDGSVPNDGAHPNAGLVQGAKGDFFGDTIYQANTLDKLAGTVFSVTAAGKLLIKKRFALDSNIWPTAPLFYYKGKLIGVGGGAVFALVQKNGHWELRFWHKFTGAPMMALILPEG